MKEEPQRQLSDAAADDLLGAPLGFASIIDVWGLDVRQRYFYLLKIDRKVIRRAREAAGCCSLCLESTSFKENNEAFVSNRVMQLEK